MEDLLFVVFREHPGRFAVIFVLDCAVHALLIVELYWIVSSSGIPLQTFEAFLIEAATKFMGLPFFFVPMQVGIAEQTYSVMFDALSLPATAAVRNVARAPPP